MSLCNSFEQAYGPGDFGPEAEREEEEMDGRLAEGVSIARNAAYRAARQIPRYRFFGDPPLHVTDAEYLKNREWGTRNR